MGILPSAWQNIKDKLNTRPYREIKVYFVNIERKISALQRGKQKEILERKKYSIALNWKIVQGQLENITFLKNILFVVRGNLNKKCVFYE